MNSNPTFAGLSDAALLEKLKSAPFFETYRHAFRNATGLPLNLVSMDSIGEPRIPCFAGAVENPFCVAVNAAKTCAGCMAARLCLAEEGLDGGKHIECFAGMRESAVPVWLGNRVVGFLTTGQVFTSPPTPEKIREIAASLAAEFRSRQEVEHLLDLLHQTRILKREQYAGIATILAAFGLQLSTLINRILLEERSSEPESVRIAKAYIMDHIDDKLTLEDVAAEAKMSTFYFCKVFKRATGMTFTEYVNRQRIEMAKQELIRSPRQITEIAFDVGYQSLSQFNRSFQKFVGESPTTYRKRMLSSTERRLVA